MNRVVPVKVNIVVNGVGLQVPEGTTIWEAARRIQIIIPRLCSLPDQSHHGSCRVCMVERKGENRLATSCDTLVTEGMVVETNSAMVRRNRRMLVELLLGSHPEDCNSCDRGGNCELQTLARETGVRTPFFERGVKEGFQPDTSHPSLVRDPNKCLLCGRCVHVCRDQQGVEAIGFVHRGTQTQVASAFGGGLGDSPCLGCGQCILACPVGALHEQHDLDSIWDVLHDPNRVVVAQVSPSTRASLGEEFGLKPGTLVTGKVVTALRRLGVKWVFDTTLAADLVVVETATELVKRFQGGGKLPLMTSCSPAWVKYLEHFHPEMLPFLSTCKSPQQVFGAIVKTYFAQKKAIPPKSLAVMAIMPCTAKKFEARRPEMKASGMPDVDHVLTNRELARLIKEAGIDFASLPDESFDQPLGIASGAADIFGVSGGVTEAVVRSATEFLTGRPLRKVDVEEVRGMAECKQVTVDLGGQSLKLVVANGLRAARALLDEIKAGNPNGYHFIEVMACPGGCVGGGGQSIPTTFEIRSMRASALYREDQGKALRKAHENPLVRQLYEEFLEEPASQKCRVLLHTKYIARSKYW